MRVSAVLPALVGASFAAAQSSNSTSNSTTVEYVTGLIEALTAGGYTTLVSYLSAAAATTEGMALIAALPGSNKTLLAPTDGAWTGVDESITGNSTALRMALAYHVLNGTYSASNVAAAPSHTIVRTALTTDKLGGRGETLALQTNSTGGLIVEAPWLHWPVQNGLVTTRTISQYKNVQVIGLDQVLNIPPKFSEIIQKSDITFANGSTFYTFGRSVGLVSTVDALQFTTVFLPTDRSFSMLNASETQRVNNDSVIETVLKNHIINGTALYSTEISTSSSPNSMAGIPFKFTVSGNVTTVHSGAWSAQIIKADIPITNGVLHYLDNVLLNINSNSSAATSVSNGNSSTSNGGSSSSGSSSNSSGALPSIQGRGIAAALSVAVGALALAL